MKIRVIATGLRFPEGPIAMPDGSVLLVEIARGTLSRVTPDGRVRVVSELGGGPNGAAMGPDGAVYICNNGGFRWTREADGCLRPIGQSAGYDGGRIERVDLATGRAERLYDAVEGHRLSGPNDLVFDAYGAFYFTDQGKVRDHDMDRGGVFYARADGRSIVPVAYPATTPNGVGLSPDGKTLYYAETEGARLWSFDILSPGVVARNPWPSPHGGRMLVASPGGTHQRFDSLAVDASGNVNIATLIDGGITVVTPDGSFSHRISLPDRFTTNLCFAGPDLRTVYVTLSGSGRLVALDDWPCPGLRLNYQ